MSQKFVPGDVVRFDYTDNKGFNTYDREVEVERVEDRDGDTLIGGNDLSLSEDGDDENYRNFYLSQMHNPELVTEESDEVAQTADTKAASSLQDFSNLLSDFMGIPRRPTDRRGALLYDLNAVLKVVESLPPGTPLVEQSIQDILVILNYVKKDIEELVK